VRIHFFIIFLIVWPFLVRAENSALVAVPVVDGIPAAEDTAWPGVITLLVDSTDVTRGIFEVRERIAVSGAGPLTLLYPKWLPGHHSPNGQISALAGIKFAVDGHPLAWRRDPVDVFAFHLDVPPGASKVEAEFQYLAPTDSTQGRIVTTPEMLNLQWNAVVLYPAGHYVRQIQIEAGIKLPENWKAESALEVATREDDTVYFKRTTVDRLVDSPVFAGANVRVESLAPGVQLDIVADEPEQLAATEGEIQFHRNLVTQALRLFGAQHYDHYDFLLAISDRQGGIGLEHHRCSENGVMDGYFTDWTNSPSRRDLLAHEYTHSWNGKYRRPADLWTPDFRTPMQDSLLWVYEGQTQFWGLVLAARAGLISKEEALGALASLAARLDTDPGRKWRPLEDTTDDPIISQRRPKPWRSWQRSEDYYNEGLLIWLDADSQIRELSHGARSLDDFAREFFGGRDGDWGEVTYDFEDVVRTLNQVQTNDWAAFLRTRLEEVSDHAPLNGITRGGYRLVYTDTPSAWFKSNEKVRKITDLTYSGGLILDKEGVVLETAWDSPAFNAGVTVGGKLIAVNGRAFDVDQLKAAIKAKKSPLSLLVRTGDIYRTVEFDYHDGLRYPQLEKTGSAPSSLEALLAPKS
jgi:predicted metalloprotease with PDZ domain